MRYRIHNEHGEDIGYSTDVRAEAEKRLDRMRRHVSAKGGEPERWISWREAGYRVVEDANRDLFH